MSTKERLSATKRGPYEYVFAGSLYSAALAVASVSSQCIL